MNAKLQTQKTFSKIFVVQKCKRKKHFQNFRKCKGVGVGVCGDVCGCGCGCGVGMAGVVGEVGVSVCAGVQGLVVDSRCGCWE